MLVPWLSVVIGHGYQGLMLAQWWLIKWLNGGEMVVNDGELMVIIMVN